MKAYSELNKKPFDNAGKILSKQFLRSGTSIGANCSEAKYAQSNRDFVSKYSIALKEANETLYWIRIMIRSELVPTSKFQSLIEENERIIKILTSSINKLKEKQ
nr:four helix bundle protein [Nostoc sp. NMS7]